MFTEISRDNARRLKDFLQEAGYDEDHLRREGYLKLIPSSRARNLPRLLDRTREPNLLNVLLRWFWLAVPQDATRATLLPEWFTDLALSVGLLRQDGDLLVAEAMLFPCQGFLAVCDHATAMSASDADFVLWPNPTTHLLSRFTLRNPSRSTLDLGTGNGAQALAAAGHSTRVVATDLNPRAINYAKFAAALNGMDNIECLLGDGFAPVSGRKFDLIVSNPPFFIGPVHRHSFCDNPMDLDHFCRRIVKEAPAYLEEGGFFQVLCEWAQTRGQSWQERVNEWVEGTGCDTWILKGSTEDAALYAQNQQNQLSVRSASLDLDAESYQKAYQDYIGYYRERNVEAVHGGIITMRRRSGQNWCITEELEQFPSDPSGDSILGFFAAQDFLRTHVADEQILSEKLRLPPGCRLEQFFQPGEGQWKPTSITLRLTQGFPFFIGLAAPIAELLSACDGRRTAGEVIQSFAQRVDAPFENVQSECVGIIRTLVERGFLIA